MGPFIITSVCPQVHPKLAMLEDFAIGESFIAKLIFITQFKHSTIGENFYSHVHRSRQSFFPTFNLRKEKHHHFARRF